MVADPDYGWARINDDDFRLAFEDSELDTEFVDVNKNTENLPVDTTIGFDFGTIKRVFKLFNIRFKIKADAELVLKKLAALSSTGAPYNVEWVINSSSDKFEWDGDSNDMMCLCTKAMGLTKEAKGDQTIYKIRQVIFREAEK